MEDLINYIVIKNVKLTKVNILLEKKLKKDGQKFNI